MPKAKAEFTIPQCRAIRVALKTEIEDKAENGENSKAAENALEEIDRAELALREEQRKRAQVRRQKADARGIALAVARTLRG